ncbi:glutamine--fructose-6-phosphate transaminase (isomerizing) [Microbacterium sp. X-17]|uniref:glutamine--fructose-6-phosphate transaminase (isomerizing) n=1 Tax=Microbacterium sp. X-17 TaxID=3144404 RepID=UPI0031F51384
MCGIVACRTHRAAGPFLLQALRLLEYRGYDSVGITLRTHEGILVTTRSVHRIEDLADRLAAGPSGAHVGIGHTRWATHGGVTEGNAHPHRDCTGRIALAHNGIIENADLLRTELVARGHRFASDVDSEVVCHLIEEQLVDGGDLASAVEVAVARLEGSWALVVLDAETGAMAATAHGSPLLVAHSRLGSFAASDATAIADWVEEAHPLREGEIVVLGDQLAWHGAPDAEHVPVRIAEARRDVEAHGFADFMAKEIAEQPAVARGILRELLPGAADGRLWRQLGTGDVDRIAIVGCGTSLNAGRIVAQAFSRIGRIPTESLVASEATGAVLGPRTLVLAFSQSGETADVLRAIEAIGDAASVVAITNNPHSSLAWLSRSIVPCQAGPEVGVAATKTFTAQVVTGLCVAVSALVATGRLTDARAGELIDALSAIPDELEHAARVSAPLMAGLVARTRAAGGFLFLGRGPAVPYADEGALKLKELTYRWAEAYPAGELKHGPLALVEPGVPIIAIDDGAPRLAGNLAEVAARGGDVIRVGGAGSDIPALAGTAQEWGPLAAVVPLQMFARDLALALGRDVEKPRNLAKAVTVE